MNCLVVAAHPDDETIWMGGAIIGHPDWQWMVMCLCRAEDPDRSAKFRRVMQALGAEGFISDLDDSSPVLQPLSNDLTEIENRIIQNVPARFDLIFTHGERGEYTRHERHEQVHRAVRDMHESGKLSGRLIYFAYTDENHSIIPRPSDDADIIVELSSDVHEKKREIVRDIYGYGEDSFEVKSAGPMESFKLENYNDLTEIPDL